MSAQKPTEPGRYLDAFGNTWRLWNDGLFAMLGNSDADPERYGPWRKLVTADAPEAVLQWCYVEKWADDSGVYERRTFDTEAEAQQYLADTAEHVAGLNREFSAEDQIVASVEVRRTYEPGPWTPAAQEGGAR